MNINAVVLNIAFIFVFLSISSAAHASFRCGKALVELGDTSYSVLKKCGDPVHSTQKGVKFLKTIFRVENVEREHVDVVNIEEWVYELERGRFSRFLTFENGNLVAVKLGERTE